MHSFGPKKRGRGKEFERLEGFYAWKIAGKTPQASFSLLHLCQKLVERATHHHFESSSAENVSE